jgi:non-ribosomal peptide synthetase component F
LSVSQLVRELRDRGIRVRAKGEQLVVQAAPGALTTDLRERIASHKAALIELLREAEAQPPIEMPASLAGLADPARPTLAPAQRRFWYLQRIDPASAIYNLPGIWRLKGPLDAGKLRDAIQAMVDRQDVLRSRFTAIDGQPVVTIVNVRVELPLVDFSDRPVAAREAAMGEFIEATIEDPIDLEQGPPFRAILIRLASDEHAILWMPHSIVWDGWSFDLLLHEMSAHYRAAVEGRTHALPPLPIQYADFAAWQNQRVERGDFDGQLAYWRRQLAGPLPSLNLPTDRERSPTLGYEGARVWSRIDGPLLEAVRELARTEGVTTYMVLLAALNVLLHRYSGARDVLVASPLQGRLHPELENLTGVFVNTLFFRTRVDPHQSFRALLLGVRDTCLEAVQHQDAPSELVIEAMEKDGLDRTPYEMIFIYQQATGRVTEMGPVSVGSVGHGIHHVAVDLVLWSREHPTQIDFGCDYRTSLFDAARISRMVAHLKAVLESAARDVEAPVGELQILTPEERRQVVSWSTGPPDGATPAGWGTLLPDAEIWSGTTRLRGEALRNALAEARREIAAKASPVPLVVDGSIECALRLAVLSEANVDALLLPPGIPATVVDDLCSRSPQAALGGASSLAGHVDGQLRIPVPGLQGGWTILDLTWEAVRRDAGVLRDAVGLPPGAGTAVYATESPDQFASAALAVLSSGGRLVLSDPRVPADGWDLEGQVAGGAVSVIVAGSRTLRQLTETGWQSRVAVVFSCNPFMPPALRAAAGERADRVVAGWGMVEVGTWALIADQGDLAAGALGRPSAGTSVLVADERGQPLPVGVPGELWIAVGSARTAQEGGRFVLPPGAPERMFRTGERVRWSEDGRLMSDGHAPGEAILDGRRVTFADIESTLRREPSVRDCHIVVRRADGERRLLALVVPHDGAVVAPAELRSRLKERLGAVLVPDAIIVLPDLGRREDGATDELRLASLLKAAASPRQHTEPRSVAERAVAEAWKEALGMTKVGVTDNFFELGGHSLLAVRVTLKLDEEHGLRIEPRALYFQTLEQVAAGALRRNASVAAVQ